MVHLALELLLLAWHQRRHNPLHGNGFAVLQHPLFEFSNQSVVTHWDKSEKNVMKTTLGVKTDGFYL
jgi:hypothetical protein